MEAQQRIPLVDSLKSWRLDGIVINGGFTDQATELGHPWV